VRTRWIACLLLFTGVAPVSAQGLGVSGVASTLGLGAELSYRTGSLGFRGGYMLFNYSRNDQLVEGVRYDLKPKLRNAQLGLDVYPLGKVFRLSGGLAYAVSRAEGLGVLDQPIVVGGQSYQPSEVGELVGELRYDRKWMPWVGLGVASGGRVAVTFDVGVMFAGHPTVQLSASGGSLTGPERVVLDQNVAMEELELQQAIDDEKWAKYYPIVSLGLRFRL